MARTDRPALEWVVTVIAGLAMIPVGFFLISSGLVAPLWAILLLLIAWAAGIWIMWRLPAWWRPVVPIALLAFWFLFISFGEAVLGWQA
jgi:membrane protein DedA with SNARE-associated domain